MLQETREDSDQAAAYEHPTPVVPQFDPMLDCQAPLEEPNTNGTNNEDSEDQPDEIQDSWYTSGIRFARIQRRRWRTI